MASTTRRRRAASFEIHEDVPSTEDAEMMRDDVQRSEAYTEEPEEADEDMQEADGDSESGEETVEDGVQIDMEKLQDSFPGFRQKYRLIKRIGEGLRSPYELP
jgi:cell division control protein 7